MSIAFFGISCVERNAFKPPQTVTHDPHMKHLAVHRCATAHRLLPYKVSKYLKKNYVAFGPYLYLLYL